MVYYCLLTLSRFSLVGGMLVHQLGFINPELNFTCFFFTSPLGRWFNCEPKFSTPILRWLRPDQSLQSPGCEILTCSAYSHMFSSGSPSESWSIQAERKIPEIVLGFEMDMGRKSTADGLEPLKNRSSLTFQAPKHDQFPYNNIWTHPYAMCQPFYPKKHMFQLRK